MDSPYWDPSHCQGYLNLSCRSNNRIGHCSQCDYLCHDLDTIEEDSLNEKSCIQVLRILMQKADEDIIKLEEDLLMLQCQLSWDNPDWSKLCSVELNSRIQYLAMLLQSSTKEVNGVRNSGVESVELGRLTHRLPDLVKSLLENHVPVKCKKDERSVIMEYTQSSCGPEKKKMAANTSKPKNKVAATKQISQTRKKSTNIPKQIPSAKRTSVKKPEGKNSKKALSNLDLEVDGYWMNAAEQTSTFIVHVEKAELGTRTHKKEDVIRKSIQYQPQNATNKFFEKDTNKPNRKTGVKMQKTAPSKPGERKLVEFQEPSNTIVKGSSPSGIRRDSSGRRAVMRNTEVMSTAKVHEYPSAKEFKVTDSLLELEKTGLKVAETVEPADVMSDSLTFGGKKYSGELIQTRETRASRHAINKKVVSKEPQVKKQKISQGPERTEPLWTGASETEYSDSDSCTDSDPLFEIQDPKRKNRSKANKKMKDKHEKQQRMDVENFGINSNMPNDSVKPVQGWGKICDRVEQIVPRMCAPNETDLEFSCGDAVTRHEKEGFEISVKNISKENEEELRWMEKDDASEVTLTSISS